MNIIEFKNVGIKFKDNWIFKGINLSIIEGEKIVLLGPSGGGKSVFLKLCLGLISPSEGEIIRLGEKNPSALHKKSGVLFQNDALFESMTIEENLLFAIDKNSKMKSLDLREYLKKFYLEEINLSDYPSRLSGGMRKRLALARALISNPEVLFIDEPTSGLDPLTAQKIISLLSEIKFSPPKTMITITHSPECAEQLGEKILFIDRQNKTINELPKNNLEKLSFDELFEERPPQKPLQVSQKQEPSFSFLTIINAFFSLIGSGYINLKCAFAIPDFKAFTKRFYADVLQSIPFILSVCFLIGFLLAMQSGSSLMKLGFIGWVPFIMAKSAFGDIGYLVIGFLLCGRVATSFCAEVWKMNLGNEIDAITVMGKSPQKIILLPVLWAFVLGFPIIFLIGEIGMLFGGAIYAGLGLGGVQLSATYYIYNAVENIKIIDIFNTIIKGIITGIIIAITPMTAGMELENPLLSKKQTPIPTAVMLSMIFIVMFNLIYP